MRNEVRVLLHDCCVVGVNLVCVVAVGCGTASGCGGGRLMIVSVSSAGNGAKGSWIRWWRGRTGRVLRRVSKGAEPGDDGLGYDSAAVGEDERVIVGREPAVSLGLAGAEFDDVASAVADVVEGWGSSAVRSSS